ncbi:MAG: B12-binding domain-containing radical SAM protein [Candidatus Omnitrophica bacterium]|nr:B12-binding domain-containing radical SAM protein [Candidatus Omnitrophota bacterium]MCF7894373.1 B12-binding domain-containing radical SAM protein [Candidatus Omnitrophota bacterium]
MRILDKKRYRLRIVIPAFPTFNIYSSVAKRTTALGPISVASVVKEIPGWDVEVIDENNLRLYGPKDPEKGADHEFLQAERPADVVGFYGGLTSTIPRLYQLASFYKKKGVTTIAGGQHFVGKNIKEALNSDIDLVVRGESEVTIKELLTSLVRQERLDQIKGIAYKDKDKIIKTKEREPIEDFESLPNPDFSLVRYAKIKMYPVSRIRGCGMDCEFCTVKGRPRYASSKKLLDTIENLLETKDARHFFIVDDLFGQQRNETIHFCKMLADYQQRVNKRLDFTVQIRLDKAKDTELLFAMREAGINTVAIGFESPIKEELEAMKKHIKPQDMIELSRIYRKFGFLIHGMFIFGYPQKGNTKINLSIKERIKRFRIFIKKAKIDTIQILLPVPLPGTELRNRLEKEGRVYSIEDIGWQYYDGNFPLFEPDDPLTAQDLQSSIHKIMGKFYKFKYVFMLGYHIFSFPALVFFLHNIRKGWKIWYRSWRNALVRFGGWAVLRGWTKSFRAGSFSDQLKKAQKHIQHD